MDEHLQAHREDPAYDRLPGIFAEICGSAAGREEDGGGIAVKSPYPYFGGKSKVANIVWDRLGNVQNYVEPFFGSGAVLLARPHEPKVETVNDMDCFLTNFWRALQNNPDGVAEWADSPVNECDLHSRHRWLCAQDGFVAKMRSDPDYFDVKVAGWWVWGLSCWIGDGWCDLKKGAMSRRPHLGDAGNGVHRGSIPHLGDAGQGGRPHLGRDQGTHAKHRSEGLYKYLGELAARSGSDCWFSVLTFRLLS